MYMYVKEKTSIIKSYTEECINVLTKTRKDEDIINVYNKYREFMDLLFYTMKIITEYDYDFIISVFNDTKELYLSCCEF